MRWFRDLQLALKFALGGVVVVIPFLVVGGRLWLGLFAAVDEMSLLVHRDNEVGVTTPSTSLPLFAVAGEADQLEAGGFSALPPASLERPGEHVSEARR